MSVRQKLFNMINELPEETASQIYDFALFLKQRKEDELEMRELAASPAFKRLAARSMKEIRSKQTLSLDELKKEIKH